MDQTPAAWGTPDPAAPDQAAPTVDGAEAAAALALAAAAEDEQKRAVGNPPWFYTSLGLCLGVLIGANAIGTEWVRVTVMVWTVAVETLIIVSLVRSWRRRGVRPQLFSALDTPVGVVQLLTLSALVLSTWLPAYAHPGWAPVLGAIAAAGYIGVCWACETWWTRHTGTASA
ncbi:MAG: hypothetical protein FWH11_06425 [Micrococcales bacterium]|nr:hypothetical protein [Micrococcales bacterium]